MAIPYCDPKSLAVLSQHGERVRFLLDSGAFTAWKSGKEIHIDDYCKFLDSLRFKPFGYFTLDVIGDPKGTKVNHQLIMKRGFHPVPIFTFGSPWEEFDEWFEYSDYIGIGGLVGTQHNTFFVRDVSRRTAGTNRRIHWLGFTDQAFIAHWRPFSCDSSAFSSAFRFKQMKIYQGGGKIVSVKQEDFRKDPSGTLAKVRHFVEWCGEDLYSLRDDKNWGLNGTAGRVTARAWASYAIEAEQRFGTKLFTAVVTANILTIYLEAWWYCASKLLK